MLHRCSIAHRQEPFGANSLRANSAINNSLIFKRFQDPMSLPLASHLTVCNWNSRALGSDL